MTGYASACRFSPPIHGPDYVALVINHILSRRFHHWVTPWHPNTRDGQALSSWAERHTIARLQCNAHPRNGHQSPFLFQVERPRNVSQLDATGLFGQTYVPTPKYSLQAMFFSSERFMFTMGTEGGRIHERTKNATAI